MLKLRWQLFVPVIIHFKKFLMSSFYDDGSDFFLPNLILQVFLVDPTIPRPDDIWNVLFF